MRRIPFKNNYIRGNSMSDGKTSFPVQDLKNAFKSRESAYCNRASAVFPAIVGKIKDTHIVFLNYWTLKNEIRHENLTINLRIYDKFGKRCGIATFQNIGLHNQFSIKSILAKTGKIEDDDFQGMVEIEVISSENLKFSFPAVIAIFSSGDRFSAVHSAGRIKNSDEIQSVSYTEETNWTCKFSKNTTPFFHIFNGPNGSNQSEIVVKLRDDQGNIVQSKTLPVEHREPFASKIYFADDLFNFDNITFGMFLSVLVQHNTVFPRLVVGNYHKNIDYYEVTHSFSAIEQQDYCPSDPSIDFESMLCAYSSPELDLSFTVFPTNCEGNFLVEPFFPKRKMQDKSENSFLIDKRQLVHRKLGTDDFAVFRFRGTQVPSRFNASFQFSVKGLVSSFSTDIASGAKSSVYPPKLRHWGHGYSEAGYETVILIRNNSHTPKNTKATSGTLKVYSNESYWERNIEVAAETATSIKLSDFIKFEESQNSNPQFLSWIIDLDQPTCETFWVSYRQLDGAIFGEHGF